MKVPTIPVAQAVLKVLVDYDVQDVVISPGSRNAPLTLGLTSNPFFKTHSIVDERSAGFFALGMAQQLQKPVVLLCTSGSALLNYYPAVAEAFYSNIPLIVMSADRPSYRIDIGDGQTLRQEGVFEHMLVDQVNLKQDVTHATNSILQSNRQELISTDIDQNTLERLQQTIIHTNTASLQKVLASALTRKGPVHVNVPMEEPLYEFQNESDISPRSVKLPDINYNYPLTAVKDVWEKAQSILVLIGCSSPDTLSEKSKKLLSDDPRVVVLTEITSNQYHKHFFPFIDQMIAPIENLDNKTEVFRSLKPDLLVTIGGMVVSKKVKSFLRSYPPEKHLHIDTTKPYDTYYIGVEQVFCKPNMFFEILKPTNQVKNAYKLRWNDLSNKRYNSHKLFFKEAPFSDFKVVGTIMKNVPENYNIQWANSTPIRYAMLFPVPEKTQSFCNRGTSGIEGSVSTAVGAAVATNQPTLLITGDLSFFYDANALWQTQLPSSLRIIVVNNRGGGIFRILPGDKDSETFKRYFETRHNMSAKHLAQHYGCSYMKAEGQFLLSWKLRSFFKPSRRPKIFEIITPSEINDKVLEDYFDALL